ncbi:hypothetical protein MMC11_001043 [Xylographa trunciseda]|nr:hypothetical protein [Xylographa trunciseda]
MSGLYPFGLSAEQGVVASPRRQRPGQPPSLLTTSLTNAQTLGHGLPLGGQTPLSTTSLSTPFSAHSSSPYPMSPGGASRGSSPMALRSAAGFSAPYNPQQWGRLSSTDSSPSTSSGLTVNVHARHLPTRTTTFAPRPVGPDGKESMIHHVLAKANTSPTEPVASPPPPYSPQRPEELQRESNVTSPSDTMSPSTDSSLGRTPTSAATTVSPGIVFPKNERRSPVSSNLQQTRSPLNGQQAAFPPPPTPTGSRFRSSSKNHADRILAAINLKGKASNASSSINAIDALHHDTAQALADRTELSYGNPASFPPAARRAASTGAIGFGTPLSRSANSSRSPTREDYGLQLPPPPPGPPPTTSARSQSLCRPSGATLAVYEASSAPGRRNNHGRGGELETIPPTPADWRDDNNENQTMWAPNSNWPRPRNLHIDTHGTAGDAVSQDSSMISLANENSASSRMRSASASGMLLRSPAVRNRSAKGIRERRSESRTGKSRALEEPISVSAITTSTIGASDERRPEDIILAPGSGGLSRRRMSSRLTPRSAKNIRGLDEALASANSLPDQALPSSSSRSTPRFDHNPYSQSLTPTSPFSSKREAFRSETTHGPTSTFVTPKVSPKMLYENRHAASLGPPITSEIRPVSSILHMPNPEVPIQVLPLSPDSSRSLIDIDEPESPKAFAHRTMNRYRLFVEREMSCDSDSERLQLFCHFMVAESRIRREKYSLVFEAEKLDLADLTTGLFDLVSAKTDNHLSGAIDAKHDGFSRRSSGTTFSESRSRRASTTATSEPILTLDTSGCSQGQGDSSRWNDYVPCLSPIASMSAVTGKDETESRGRTPSRWWESHSGESTHGDGFKVLERTKRESRYMALPQEARYSPAMFDTEISPRMNDQYQSGNSTSHRISYGPDEYPPEKQGWHEESMIPRPPTHPATPSIAPFSPDPRKLDVSRLITLPPPYPRHHPAVNNSHPELADVRAIVRSLNEIEGTETTREQYQTRISEKRLRADSWCKHQRSLHSQDIQYRMENGDISQEQFDQAEADIEAKEGQSKKELLQTEFDLFQSTVVSPLHALFSERITKASSAFEQLSTRLSADAENSNPNIVQEEGDEQPELLEKLTQLKWLFEAREHLHKETYNLLSERNEKYKAIVLLPYQQTHNHEKLADAKSFFDKDALSRRVAHEKAALERFEEFLSIIEAHVTRGVEIQISAFWDIAPSLLSLLQEIPSREYLQNFEILIPRAEVDENPAYWAHPLRYLYSLLNHAESSSRQFIESQVSLWCLLQEVREGANGARWRVKESEAGCEGRELGWQGEERKAEQQSALVDDLKDKVGVVERQWEEALGGEVRRVREGVREWLEETGGWDEELEGE